MYKGNVGTMLGVDALHKLYRYGHMVPGGWGVLVRSGGLEVVNEVRGFEEDVYEVRWCYWFLVPVLGLSVQRTKNRLFSSLYTSSLHLARGVEWTAGRFKRCSVGCYQRRCEEFRRARTGRWSA